MGSEMCIRDRNNIVANVDALQDSSPAAPQMTVAQRSNLRYSALKCLSQAMRSLFAWHEQLTSARFLSVCPCRRARC